MEYKSTQAERDYQKNYYKENRDQVNARMREYAKKNRKTAKGRAQHTWSNIKSRAGKRQDYINVEVRMTKEEWLAWAVPQYEKWFKERPGVTPSINRIDGKGHYEIGNLELVSSYDNGCMGLRNAHLSRAYKLFKAIASIPLTY